MRSVVTASEVKQSMAPRVERWIASSLGSSQCRRRRHRSREDFGKFFKRAIPDGNAQGGGFNALRGRGKNRSLGRQDGEILAAKTAVTVLESKDGRSLIASDGKPIGYVETRELSPIAEAEGPSR